MPLYFGSDGAAKEISELYAGVSGAYRGISNLYAGVDGAARELLPQVALKTWKRIPVTVDSAAKYSKTLNRKATVTVGSEIYFDGTIYRLCGNTVTVTASSFDEAYFGMYVFPSGTTQLSFSTSGSEVYRIESSSKMCTWGATSWREMLSLSSYQDRCETVSAEDETYPDDGTLDGYYYILQN